MQESTILGLGGLLVGAFSVAASLWWSYRTRALPHREFLYNKQIEMYVQLTTSMRHLLGPCIDFTDKLTSANRAEFDDKADEAQRGIMEQFYKGLPILPYEVMDSILRLLDTFTEVDKLTSATKIQNTLVKAELDVHDAIRESAGIDRLSDEMRRIFGER